MMLTKGAIGNLINRYSAVLKKCSLINTFGSLAVAGMLVAGGVSGAMAGEDVIKDGETASITESVSGKVIGGLRLSGNIDSTMNTVDSTNITVSANVTDDICGGGYLSTPTGAIVEMMTGETNLTITTGEIGSSTNGIVIAGNRVVSYPTTSINKANTVLSNANLTISGGTFNNKVIGSSYAKAIGQNQDNRGYHGEASALTTRTNTQIAGGTFKDIFVGGGLAESLGTAGTNNGNYAKSETGIVYTQIKGGSFENSVIGGGYAHNASKVTGYVSEVSAPVEQAALIITGGTFNKSVYGGGYATGTRASAVVTGDTTVTISGGTFKDNIVAGGLDGNVTGSTSLAISGITMNTVKGDVVGGGAASKKTADVGGDTSVTISGAIPNGLQGNVYGGGLANGNASGVAATVTGSTTVSLASIVNEAVFGGGRARSQSQAAAANVGKDTSVTLLTGAVAHGVAGGGWAHDYKNISSDTTTANVTGTATVNIQGGTVGTFYQAEMTKGISAKTESLKVGVVGGGIASGTHAQATVDTTKLTISGGTVNADVVGGGMVYISNRDNERSGGTATVGTTNVAITGGTIEGNVYGGGYAEGGASGNTTNANVTTANIILSGADTTVNGNIYAGGYAQNATYDSATVGTATVRFLNNIKGTGTVYGGGAGNGVTTVTSSTLAFGDNSAVYNSTFNRAFSGFTNLSVAQGSTLTLAYGESKTGFDNTNVGSSLTLNGKGTVIADVALNGDYDLSITDGVLQSKNIKLAQAGNMAISGGKVSLQDGGTLTTSAAGTVELSGTGVFSANNASLLTTEYAAKTGVNIDSFNLGSGSTLEIIWAENTKLTKDNLSIIKTSLVGTDTGLIVHKGATITVDTHDINTTDADLSGTLDASKISGYAGTLLEGTTVGANTTGTTTNIASSFGADALVIKSDTSAEQTANLTDKVVTLTGAGGKLIETVGTAAGQDVKVKLTTGTLNIGNATTAAGSGTIAAVDMGTSGTLNATNGNYTVGEITTSGSGAGTVSASAGGILKVDGNIGGNTLFLKEVKAEGGNISVGGALHSHTVTATGGTIVANDVRTTDIALDKGGTLTTTNLTMTSGGKGITVGSTEGGAGTLIVTGEANLKGASLFLDPAWKGNDELKDASKAVLNFGDGGIDGLLTAGQNSYIVLGDTDTKWAENAFQNSGLKWGKNDVTAALFVKSSQSLATNGGILVDGNIDAAAFATGATNKATANTAEFRANSLLAVYAPNMTGDKVALTSTNGTLTVAESAKLHIMGGKANDTVKIVSGFTAGSTIGGWSTNLTTDSKLLTANAGTLISGAYDVTLSQNSTRSIFPKLDKNMAGLVDGMVRQIGLDPMSENYGQRFVSRAVSDSYIGSNNTKEAAATIEGAAKMAFAGAAPQIGLNLANAAGNIAGLRNSLSAAPQGAVVALNADGTSAQEGLSAGDGMKNGLGLWVMPTYQNQQGFGFESGDFETGYKSNAAGVALGADYTFNDMFRVGAQFNVGGGYAESTGDFNSTDNRFNYWGLGLYAGYQYQNFGLTADFGYSANNNELEQSLPKAMDMASLKADAKTDTITAGLRGEYKITTDALDIVPHLGVRMTNMHMDSFNVKSDKHKVFKADDMNATVWTFPVGVTFSKDIETSNGWTIKPSLDLAIIPAAGDIEAKQDVKIVGVNGTASMESNIMDAISYQGSLGLSVKNDNGVSVGVNYTLQAGAHTTDHGVQATFRYEF